MAKAATVTNIKSVPTIGSLIDAMAKISRERTALAAQDKKLKETLDGHQKDLIEKLREQGTGVAESRGVKAMLKVTPRPQIKDDLALWKYCKKHDYFHLYYRRLKQEAYEELVALNNGQPLPGTEMFEDVSISLTGLKSAA